MQKTLLLLVTVVTSSLIGQLAVAEDLARGLARKESTATSTQTPFVAGTYRALIIGNNKYQDPEGKWRNLNTAVTDAESVARLLRENYGFTDIKMLRNAKKREIELALSDLSDRAQSNDSLFVYYAGHGYLDKSQRGYWVPVDAKGLDHTTFIRNSTIKDELENLAQRVKHTLLVSDSCFSGSLLRGNNRAASENDRSQTYYQRVAQKKSVQLISAGGVEFVDDDYRNSGHSPFTYFLLNELKTNNQSLFTASELALQIEKAVANNVKQTPESGVLQGAGDENGEFIFAKLGLSPNQMFVSTNDGPMVNDAETETRSVTTKPLMLQIPGL